MKILITGNAGAGKSTFGKMLAKKYNLNLYGLDKIVWKENWLKTPKEERDLLVQKILSKDSWIIEGITKNGLSEASIVYFLDIPAYRCSFNVLTRFLKNGIGTRPDLPDNCPEYRGFFKALKTNYIFHKVTKPWLLDKSLRKKGAKFITIKKYSELKNILEKKL